MPEEFNFLHQRLERLLEVFHCCFFDNFNTRIVGGFSEPCYRPAGGNQEHHRIEFTRDYFSSALHEVAHWCIARPQRREQEDYGYWYAPDGRDSSQQKAFETLEVKPQALERLFSAASGQSFRVSADNLGVGCGPSADFKRNIHAQTLIYCSDALPQRAQIFIKALAKSFEQPEPLNPYRYTLDQLD